MNTELSTRESFFTKDTLFYKTLFGLILTITLQNLIAYSVNMLDNIMLGSYSQNALSGAATVNQVFFMVQQTALPIGNALVALASQYWGQKQTQPIRELTGIALKFCLLVSVLVMVVCTVFPVQLLRIFTTSDEIIAKGLVYLSILKWTFVLFIFSNLLIAMLRSVGTVRISFIVSVVSLIVNGCINYTLIFGHFGFPEMGIKGAAIGTLISRIAELLILLFYVAKMDTKIRLFSSSLFSGSREQVRSFLKVGIPIMITSLLWAVSVPMQTAILGHLSSDAIAANSVSSTFYQYLKVVVIALSSASAVMIGNSIGAGDLKRVRSDARTLSVIDILIGLILAAILFVCRTPLLSMYRLSNEAMILADHFMIIMSVIMVGMSYQMPVSMGIIQSSGDTKFALRLNLISTWLIVMPLSFLAAFVWKWPVELVVVAVQCDQIFKGLPIFLRFRSYRWIHKLTA